MQPNPITEPGLLGPFDSKTQEGTNTFEQGTNTVPPGQRRVPKREGVEEASLPPTTKLVLMTSPPFDVSKGKLKGITQKALLNLLPYFGIPLFKANAKKIDQLVGQDNRPFGKWFRSQILSCEEQNKGSIGRANRWSVCQERYMNLWELAFNEIWNKDRIMIREWTRKFAPYFAGQKPEYTDTGGRRYCELQMLPNAYKPFVLKGCTEFDMSTAAPTIVIQAAMMIDPSYIPSRAIAYIQKKKQLRLAIANMIDVDEKTAKEVMTCIASLAKDDPSPFSGLFRVLGNDREKLNILKRSDWVQGFRADMEWAYDTLLGDLSQDGEARFRCYEQVERAIIDIVVAYLNKKGVNHLVQHDGFLILDKGVEISGDYLTSLVEQQLSLTITFDEDKW